MATTYNNNKFKKNRPTNRLLMSRTDKSPPVTAVRHGRVPLRKENRTHADNDDDMIPVGFIYKIINK